MILIFMGCTREVMLFASINLLGGMVASGLPHNSIQGTWHIVGASEIDLLNDRIRAGYQTHLFDSYNILLQLYAGTNVKNKYGLYLNLKKLIMSGQDGVRT